MEAAVDMVAAGALSQRQAVEQYGVSRSALQHHTDGNVKAKGRPTTLTKETEDVLARTLNTVAKWDLE